MKKFFLSLDLQMFADEMEDPGVEDVPAAEVQAETQVETSETGAGKEVAAEPEKQNNFEKAFAKRLAAKEAEWEAKNAEKYKDYDVLKTTAEFFQERHGFQDLLSMKEEIELEKLQARAEKEQVPPEVLKRLDFLEAKAAKADEYEQQTQQSKQHQEYFSRLDEFVKDKGVTTADFNQYMIDNQVLLNTEAWEKSLTIALKAMKAEEYEKKANEKESETISRYLSSKSAPRVDGSTGAASAQSVDTTKMSWKDLERHASARLDASKTPS